MTSGLDGRVIGQLYFILLVKYIVRNKNIFIDVMLDEPYHFVLKKTKHQFLQNY